jgi:hypothetical protein
MLSASSFRVAKAEKKRRSLQELLNRAWSWTEGWSQLANAQDINVEARAEAGA